MQLRAKPEGQVAGAAVGGIAFGPVWHGGARELKMNSEGIRISRETME